MYDACLSTTYNYIGTQASVIKMKKGLNFLKNGINLCKSIQSIIILYCAAVIGVLWILNVNTQNQLKFNYNKNLQVVSENEELRIILPSDTREYDHYNNGVDNSKQGKLDNNNTQNISPRHHIDLCKKTVSIQTNNSADPEMNATHIKEILMEPVHVNYTRNIYFSVKTTHKNFEKRLFPLMLTWLQLVDKNKVSQC